MGSTISSGRNGTKLNYELLLDKFVDNIFYVIMYTHSDFLKYRKLENLSDLLIFIGLIDDGEYKEFSLISRERESDSVYTDISLYNPNIDLRNVDYHSSRLFYNVYDKKDRGLGSISKKYGNFRYYTNEFDNDLLKSKIFNGVYHKESIYEKLFNRMEKVTDLVLRMEDEKKKYNEELNMLGEIPLDNIQLRIKKDKLEKSIISVEENMSLYGREQLFNIEILKECFRITESSNEKMPVDTFLQHQVLK